MSSSGWYRAVCETVSFQSPKLCFPQFTQQSPHQGILGLGFGLLLPQFLAALSQSFHAIRGVVKSEVSPRGLEPPFNAPRKTWHEACGLGLPAPIWMFPAAPWDRGVCARSLILDPVFFLLVSFLHPQFQVQVRRVRARSSCISYLSSALE